MFLSVNSKVNEQTIYELYSIANLQTVFPIEELKGENQISGSTENAYYYFKVLLSDKKVYRINCIKATAKPPSKK